MFSDASLHVHILQLVRAGRRPHEAPFSSMITAGGPSIFQDGKECGACYQVKCSGHASCFDRPVTVVVTDSCPDCVDEPVRFDLSGTAFGAMAAPGQADQLLNAGRLQIQYTRVSCNWGNGLDIAFRVDGGSNPNYIAVAIEYEDGDGDLSGVELMQSGAAWQPMQRSWGAVWKYNSGAALQGPLSIRLTSGSGKTLEATNVIPGGWTAGATYRSVVNYNPN
ncbi:hypothetical protein EJB05_50453, partial [Eragrostis curvula]